VLHPLGGAAGLASIAASVRPQIRSLRAVDPSLLLMRGDPGEATMAASHRKGDPMAQQTRDQYKDDSAAMVEERPTIRAAEPRLDGRRGFLASDGLLILLGLWLVASPFVLSYGAGDEKWLPVLSGTLIAAAAVLALAEVVPRLAAAWGVIGIAICLFVGGLVLADSAVATWNAVAGGALVAFLALAAAAASIGQSEER
jgi:hypothetical protein